MTHSNCRNIEPLILLMASIGGLDQSNEIENELNLFSIRGLILSGHTGVYHINAVSLKCR